MRALGTASATVLWLLAAAAGAQDGGAAAAPPASAVPVEPVQTVPVEPVQTVPAVPEVPAPAPATALDAGVVSSDAGVPMTLPVELLDAGVAATAADAAPVVVLPAPEAPALPPAPENREEPPYRDYAPGADPEPTFVPVPVPAMEPNLLDDLLPMLPEGGPWTTAGLLVLLLIGLVVSGAMRRLREGLPEAGVLPRSVDFVHTLVRIAIFLVGLALLARMMPASLGPGLSWVLLAAAAAVGWSARDVLPDLIAGMVLFFERRIRRGVWVTAAGHSGIVETRGLRAVWLRDGLGHRIALPNRLLLSDAVVSQPGGAFHDVSVRFEATGVPAARLRQALHDAVLTSPWVQPEAGEIVRRDGMDPTVWHVRARLIDVRFAVSFEGDLLERAEEMLAAERTRALEADWD